MGPAGYANVAVLVDVAGALAAQLQGHGGQVFGSGLHDHFAHRTVTGVEDVIESLAQKLLGLCYSSRHYRVKFLKQNKQLKRHKSKESKLLEEFAFILSRLFKCTPTRNIMLYYV